MTTRDLERFASVVDQCITVTMTQERRASMIWFSYNVGAHAFKTSTLVKLMNSGDTIAACNQLDRWVYVKGKYTRGLANRRAIEKEYCLLGT